MAATSGPAPNGFLSLTPPPVKYPYEPANALDDIPGVSYALELFLASHMVESEEYCHKSDETKERLYFATGYGLIQCVKGLMSYADEDLLSGINHTKHGNQIASAHRKKTSFLGSRLAGYVVSSFTPSSGVAFIKGMTPVERHAELVYAESLFEKALLGIVYSGDWMAFVKEALNMRTTISIYRQLGAYIEDADAAYAAAHSPGASTPSTPTSSTAPSSPLTSSSDSSLTSTSPPSSTSPASPQIQTPAPGTGAGGSQPRTPSTQLPSTQAPAQTSLEDPTIDVHFRSGVYLGVGMCNIILSLMPGKLATLVELFGYKGDRAVGLKMLMRAGGWDAGGGGDGPAIEAADEGVRRSICDMCLLLFHLVLSSFTFDGVDVGVAQRVLDWNLKRYPNGVFFLFGAGRLALCRSQPRRAIHFYTQALESQTQYRNLHHVSFWEIAIANLALWDLGASLVCWRDLEKEATWSKSIYSFGVAVCMLEVGTTEKEKKEAAKMMARVPELRQKIAGKSIPLEKFVARKARKFSSQNNRLVLPGLEVAYVFQGIAHAPREVITGKMLPEVRKVLDRLGGYSAVGGGGSESGGGGGKKQTQKGRKLVKSYEGGAHEYYDDLCLARFLEGVCLRYVAYPDPDAVLDPEEVVSMLKEDAEKGAVAAFEAVFEFGPKIELDHHLVYHAHYELGRLLACQGNVEGARAQFDLVLSGKYLEVGPSGRKGKYSMENALLMRTHAAVDALHQKRL